jgi:hypothetical protein
MFEYSRIIHILTVAQQITIFAISYHAFGTKLPIMEVASSKYLPADHGWKHLQFGSPIEMGKILAWRFSETKSWAHVLP